MIKYRVFYKPENKYLDRGSNQLFINQKGRVFWYFYEGFEDITDKVIIEQFTGLKDKNGVEVYEGDIVSRGDGNFIVRYKNDKYYIGYVASMDDENCSYIHIWYDGIEVVGNIHQNPELLEAK